MTIKLAELAEQILTGANLDLQTALDLSQTSELNELFFWADQIRERFRGSKVDLCTIMNAKSGQCSENCKFCAQSVHYQTGIKEYPLVTKEVALEMALENQVAGVKRFSLVTSGKVLTGEDFEQILEIFVALKGATSLRLCASLGCISLEQARALQQVGVERYHHNLESNREFYPEICNTHPYELRVATIKNAQAVGLDVCAGGIIGLGEQLSDRIKLAFELRELGVRSIPVNVLNPIKGTPLEQQKILDPLEILKTFALFRLIIPDGEVRYAGGRVSLGEQQKVGLRAGVNAVLVGNYLTTIGNQIEADLKMITEAGLEV